MQWHLRGEQLHKQEEWSKAAQAYGKAIALNPQFSWAHHSLGNVLIELQDWSGAVAALERAIALNPQFAWSHYSRGLALSQLGRWDEAIRAYHQARSRDTSIDLVSPKLAELLQQQIQDNPRQVSLYQELAQEWIRQGKEEKAIATYQMALQISPCDRALALALAQLLLPTDPNQAHALLERALKKPQGLRSGPAQGLLEADPRQAPRQGVCKKPREDHENETIELARLSNLAQAADCLSRTSLFDPAYYHRTYGIQTTRNLLEHYLKIGARQGYRPNPLFDTNYYHQQNPNLAQLGINPLIHYYQMGRSEGHNPHACFDHQFYLAQNTDVAAAKICPLEHYLSYGAKEGRVAFSVEQVRQWYQQPTSDHPDAWTIQNQENQNQENQNQENQNQENQNQENQNQENGMNPAIRQSFGIYCSSVGNYFIAEIADFVASALERVGHQAVRLDETTLPPEELNIYIIVAPHEFFYLGEGIHFAGQTDWWSRAIMINVEQPQTAWFSKAFHFLRNAHWVLDINVKTAEILRQLGLPADWLPLGYLDNDEMFVGSDALPDLLALRSLGLQLRQSRPAIDAPLKERAIDIHFIGTLNSRREKFFAQSAHWLSQYRCFLHMPAMRGPFIKGEGQALDTDAVIGISRRSKILLNIHRDNLPYFEWHRIVFHGLWQNTLVVTELCHEVPGLLPGIHFIACPLEEMKEKIEWLLKTTDGQAEAERVRWAGHQRLKQKFSSDQILKYVISLFQDKASRETIIPF